MPILYPKRTSSLRHPTWLPARLSLLFVLVALSSLPAAATDLAPTAVIDVSPHRSGFVVYAGENVGFFGGSSHDNDEGGNTITNYTWSLDGVVQLSGPGLPGNLWATTFSLGAAGADTSYQVQLCVTDDEGTADSLAIEVQVRQGPRRYYYVADHLGSVRAVVGEDGSVVSRRDYYPFGEEMGGRVLVGEEASKETYTGHEHDDETGLLYAGARYLDPAIGRFMSTDPANEYASPYVYVGNNPINLVDPTGMYSEGANHIAWHYGPNGELVADPGDNYFTLLSFLGVEWQAQAIWGALQDNGQVNADGSVDAGQSLSAGDQLFALRDAYHGVGMMQGVEYLSYLVGLRALANVGRGGLAFLVGRGALAGYTTAEAAVIREAFHIIRSPQFARALQALRSGTAAEISVGGRTILFEPGLGASGMTMFGESGFVVGREALKSNAELYKTVLHELYRLHTTASRGAQVGQALIAQETQAAFGFAERAVGALMTLLK